MCHRRAEDTSRHERQQTKSWRAASTGPPSSRTPTVSTQSAYNVKRRSTSPSKMRCQCGQSWRWKSLKIWGIYFMGPFPPSDEKEYILVAVDYVSKWDEVIPT